MHNMMKDHEWVPRLNIQKLQMSSYYEHRYARVL